MLSRRIPRVQISHYPDVVTGYPVEISGKSPSITDTEPQESRAPARTQPVDNSASHRRQLAENFVSFPSNLLYNRTN